MLYEFNGYRPVVHPSAFVHPQAVLTGNVIIGRDVYIGPGAALRGDWGEIVVKDGCNVQENCTIHMFPGIMVVLEQGAHIGHGAIIHGAQVGRDAPRKVVCGQYAKRGAPGTAQHTSIVGHLGQRAPGVERLCIAR